MSGVTFPTTKQPLEVPLSVGDLPNKNTDLAAELTRLQREEQDARDRENERQLELVRQRAKFD